MERAAKIRGSFLRLYNRRIVATILVAVVLLLPTKTSAQALTHNETEQKTVLLTRIAELLKLIDQLQQRLNDKLAHKPLQSISLYNGAFTVTQTDAAVTGSTTIDITSPKNASVFPWTGEQESFRLAWTATNVPANAVVDSEAEMIRSYRGSGGYSGVGGGELPVGDSTGTSVKRYGPTLQDQGEYRLRLIVRGCHSQGCSVNPYFPGQEEDVPVYATSDWFYFAIGNRDYPVYDTNGTVSITDIRPTDGVVYFNEPTDVSFILSGVPETSQHQVCFFPERKSTLGAYTTETSCTTAKNGSNHITWFPTSWMPAGEYRLQIKVFDVPDDSGKDTGILAYRRADWFELKYKQPASPAQYSKNDLEPTLDLHTGFMLPVSTARVSKIEPLSAIHFAVAKGTAVHAAAAGTVLISKTSGWNSGLGQYVVIEHAPGVTTLYAHLSQTTVVAGDSVKQDEVIGLSGDTGNTTGPVLYFKFGGVQNPFSYKW